MYILFYFMLSCFIILKCQALVLKLPWQILWIHFTASKIHFHLWYRICFSPCLKYLLCIYKVSQKNWVLLIRNSINFEHLEHPSNHLNCQDKKNSMHYRQSLVIKSCLLCTVFDNHLSKLSYGYHMVETFTNFQENGDIRWQLGPMDVKAQGVSGAGSWPHRVQNELRRDQKVFLFITSIVSNHQLSYSWSYEYMHPQVNPRRFRR